MGVAALWIMLYHSRLFFDAADGTGIFHYLYVFLYNLYQLRSAGQVGVDIFLFLSAIGLYFSLEKDPDVSSFYKRRAIRVLPEYLLINILWSMYLGEGPVELSRNLCGLSFVLDGNLDNWYFILLFFLYLSFPLLFRYKKKYGNRFVFIVFLFSVLLNAALSELAPTVFETVEIALRRIPVFLLGLFIAGDVYIGTKIKHIYIVPIALILFVLSLEYLINTDHLNEMFIIMYAA